MWRRFALLAGSRWQFEPVHTLGRLGPPERSAVRGARGPGRQRGHVERNPVGKNVHAGEYPRILTAEVGPYDHGNRLRENLAAQGAASYHDNVLHKFDDVVVDKEGIVVETEDESSRAGGYPVKDDGSSCCGGCTNSHMSPGPLWLLQEQATQDLWLLEGVGDAGCEAMRLSL